MIESTSDCRWLKIFDIYIKKVKKHLFIVKICYNFINITLNIIQILNLFYNHLSTY